MGSLERTAAGPLHCEPSSNESFVCAEQPVLPHCRQLLGS